MADTKRRLTQNRGSQHGREEDDTYDRQGRGDARPGNGLVDRDRRRPQADLRGFSLTALPSGCQSELRSARSPGPWQKAGESSDLLGPLGGTRGGGPAAVGLIGSTDAMPETQAAAPSPQTTRSPPPWTLTGSQPPDGARFLGGRLDLFGASGCPVAARRRPPTTTQNDRRGAQLRQMVDNTRTRGTARRDPVGAFPLVKWQRIRDSNS